MQSLNELDQVIQTDVFESGKIDDIGKRIKFARSKGAVKHVVAYLPDKGSIIEINGLKYEVKFTDYKRGEVRLKLIVVTKEF